MLTYKNIAVGTDGSETSLRAVRAAASMARAYDCLLYTSTLPTNREV